MRTENRELFSLPLASGAIAVFALLLPCPAAASPESARLRASAFAHLYNLDYDEAARDMEAAVKADPHDIASERGLAVIPWVLTTFRRGMLTVDEYLGKVTGSNVAMAQPPSDLAARFQDHVTRATRLAETAIAERPRDADAHYQLGAAVGLQASYTATVEGRMLGAFRSAKRAFDEHERVLQIDPSRHDANLIVGTYRSLVSGLSPPIRFFAYVAGFGGGKARGVQMMEAAAAYPGDGRPEATIGLVLVYNRESRYEQALRTIGELQRTYPRNHILWLEAGATELRAGHHGQAEILLTEGLARMAADPRPRMFGEEALLYLKRGIARAALKRPKEAGEDLKRVLVLEARPWVRAEAQAEMGKLRKASGK